MKIKKEKKSDIKRLFKFTKGNNISFIAGFVFSIIIAVAAAFGGYAMQILIDSAVSKSRSRLIYSIEFIAVFMVVEAAAETAFKYFSGKSEEGIMFNIRKYFVEHVISMSPSQIEHEKVGDLESRYINDINNIKNFFTQTVFDIVKQPLLIIVSLSYMFYLNWQLTLISLSITPVFIFLSMKITKPVYKYTKQQQDALSNENSVLFNNLMGITTIKAFLLEKLMGKRYNESVDKSVSRELELAKVNVKIQPLLFAMNIFPFLIIFITGSYLILNHIITLGRMMAIIQLQNYVINPVLRFPNILSSINSTRGSSSHIFEIMDKPSERTNGEEFDVKDSSVAVSIKNAEFAYDLKNDVIDGLNADIKEGQTTAIAGRSGCGKSTLLKLITGSYKLKGGEICLMGHDINDWNLRSLRNVIASVPQSTYIFPLSVYENITLGNKNVNENDVINAAKAANIHDLIMSMPKGYDTVLGENGVNLSGGEKQRISIARAILKKAPVILMDEPTSALDAQNEKLVNKSIEYLMKHHTVIIVAHRLSTIKNASSIVVMDDGKVSDLGTHDELIKRCNLYNELYSKQFSLKEA